MNIENIIALGKQLQLLGFQDAGSMLLKRICFKPENFCMLQRITKAKEALLFSLYFERMQNNDTYTLLYYDVTLQKENSLSSLPVDGINALELEKQMAAIDWKKAFSLDDKKMWNPDDKSTWDIELKVSNIMESLSILENSETGKSIAASLKQKFWSGTLYQEIVGPVAAVKSKTEVSQRFYFSEDNLGITVDEAYRFLQNKWMEKQLQQKRKQADSREDESEEENTGASSNGLLKKKRIAPGRSKHHKGKAE